MLLEDLALIGNCQFSALVSNRGEICWACLPRFASEPLFSSLLDAKAGGRFLIGAADGSVGRPRYLPNTTVLETTFTSQEGSFRVFHCPPRFPSRGSFAPPPQLVGVAEPLEGHPRIRAYCTPTL